MSFINSSYPLILRRIFSCPQIIASPRLPMSLVVLSSDKTTSLILSSNTTFISSCCPIIEIISVLNKSGFIELLTYSNHIGSTFDKSVVSISSSL